MSKKDKLIERLKNNPKDFTFDEMRNVLEFSVLRCPTRGKQAVLV